MMPDDSRSNNNTPPANDSGHVPEQQQSSSQHRTPRCGLCCWRPNCLQVGYNWKLALFLMCWYTFLRGILLGGLHSINSSSFEKRFGVESQQVGWFTSVGKFALGSSTIVFSYYGDRTGNKPRLIAFSAFLMALGSFLMALPHFIMEPYRGQSLTVPPMCYRDNDYYRSIFTNASILDPATQTMPECKYTSPVYFNILIAANVVIGVSNGIYVGVGTAFIDDFSSIASSSFNLGASYLSNAIGTGVGFGVGSVLMSVDVNVNYPSVPKQNPADPTFLGAWWLGYTICIALYGTVAISFIFFDNELPESAGLKDEKLAKTQTHVSTIKVDLNETGRSKIGRLLVTFFNHVLRVVTNPVVVAITIAIVLSVLPIGGLQPFLIKIMQTVYGINEMMAGVTMGLLIVIGIAVGTFLSGLLVQRLKMTVRSMLLVTIIATFLCVGFTFLVALSCPAEKFVGVTYDADTNCYTSGKQFNSSVLQRSCNADCRCKKEYYIAACHSPSGLEFYSPCFAGCEHFGKDANNNTDFFSFKDCSCLKEDGNVDNASTSMAFGLCANNSCPKMYGAMIGIFLMLFCGFFVLVPVTEVIMRCVPLEERSFALAFFESLQVFLGAVPGPLLMGAIFDRSCILHQPGPCANKDGSIDDGACVTYDSSAVTYQLIGMIAGFNFLSAICFVVAFFTYKPPSGETLRQYFSKLSNWWFQRNKTGNISSEFAETSTNTEPIIIANNNNAIAPASSDYLQLDNVGDFTRKTTPIQNKPAEIVREDSSAVI